MRVIAGLLKGRRLEGPRWQGLRPTSDALRETLFNILAERVRGAKVLDGYAGTGALGIEALSRGARHVTFVDVDRRAAALIARNLEKCGVTGGYTILTAPVSALPSRPGGAPFDLVLLDPPYAGDTPGQALGWVRDLVAAGGLVVLEHAARTPVPEQAGRLVRVREVRAGDSALALYAAGPEERRTDESGFRSS